MKLKLLTKKIIKKLDEEMFEIDDEDSEEIKNKITGTNEVSIAILINFLVKKGIIKEKHLKGN